MYPFEIIKTVPERHNIKMYLDDGKVVICHVASYKKFIFDPVTKEKTPISNETFNKMKTERRKERISEMSDENRQYHAQQIELEIYSLERKLEKLKAQLEEYKRS